jgi:hypothetical protein
VLKHQASPLTSTVPIVKQENDASQYYSKTNRQLLQIRPKRRSCRMVQAGLRFSPAVHSRAHLRCSQGPRSQLEGGQMSDSHFAPVPAPAQASLTDEQLDALGSLLVLSTSMVEHQTAEVLNVLCDEIQARADSPARIGELCAVIKKRIDFYQFSDPETLRREALENIDEEVIRCLSVAEAIAEDEAEEARLREWTGALPSNVIDISSRKRLN